MDVVHGDLLFGMALGVLATVLVVMGLVVVVIVVEKIAKVICTMLRRGKADRLLEVMPDAPYEEVLLRAAGGGGGEPNKCVICQAAYETGERCLVLPACGHMFHKACIAAWLRRRATCPLCRAKLVLEGAADVRQRLENAAWNMV